MYVGKVLKIVRNLHMHIYLCMFPIIDNYFKYVFLSSDFKIYCLYQNKVGKIPISLGKIANLMKMFEAGVHKLYI